MPKPIDFNALMNMKLGTVISPISIDGTTGETIVGSPLVMTRRITSIGGEKIGVFCDDLLPNFTGHFPRRIVASSQPQEFMVYDPKELAIAAKTIVDAMSLVRAEESEG